MMRTVTLDRADDRLLDLLRFLVLGSRGGATRRKILELLLKCPQNAHRMCRALRLNYGTVASHLRVLERFGLVTTISISRYNRGYSVAPILRGNRALVDILRESRGNGPASPAVQHRGVPTES